MAASNVKKDRPVVGVLPGWAVYDRAILQNFLGLVLQGINHAARDRRCDLLLACGVWLPGDDIHVNHPAWPVSLPEADFVPVGPWNTDGLIVINPLIDQARIQYIGDLAAAGHPVVFIGTEHQGTPTVAIDNRAGIQQAVDHLVKQHGHRRIAFIAGDPNDTHGDSEERLQAYLTAVGDHHLPVDSDLVVPGYHIVEGGRLAMQELLDKKVEFTAVLASSDESAIGAMQVLREHDLRVPQDVAVLGFDDQLESRIQSPPLTSIHCPMFERGYRAAGLLLEHIENRDCDTRIIRVPTRLVVRQSCGCEPRIMSLALPDRPTPISGGNDLSSISAHIASDMAEGVLTVAHGLTSDMVHSFCRRMVESFVQSLKQSNPAVFKSVLQEMLRQVEGLGEDAYVWQRAISVLRSQLSQLAQQETWPSAPHEIEDLLHWARTAISQAVHLRYRRHFFEQRWTSDRMAVLTGQLLTIVDEAQVSDLLRELLPELGIKHAAVAFYQPEGDDPVYWTNLYSTQSQTENPFRFPSRQFPPPGLYEPSELLSLAILPLVIQDELAGFVAFDSGNLALCGAIMQQLAEALRSVRLYREATRGRRLAEEANRMKSRFLSTVSHELRTPLNLIVGLSEVVLHEEKDGGPPLAEVYRQDLERILTSAQHLDALIQDVLDLARSEVGQLKLAYEPLDMTEVLQMVATIGEQLAREKNLVWRSEIPAELPRVWGDRTRLRQVALNLVNNAIKFTAHGEVAFLVHEGQETLTVTVSDTGLGIPLSEQEVIFDEFRQSERTTARGYGGLGLGLAICRRLVELHGGKIGVDSSGREGDGSSFYFRLPVMEQSPRVPAPSQSSKVLLLSEFYGQAEQLCQHLNQQGFEVEEIGTGETSNWLSQLLASPPGAVLMDEALASEHGWQVLQLIKDDPALQDIPVLFYSLSAEQQSGALLEFDYLTKPVGTAALAQALKRQGLNDVQDGEKLILLVDDEPEILDMHARIVEAQSSAYRVLKAQDGRQALALIRQRPPDLILLDLMMPELDGFAVLEAMQQAGETIRNIPVIVLSGQALTEDDMNRLKGGVSAILRKGLFSVEETMVHLEQALACRHKLGGGMQRLVRQAMAYIHEHYASSISRDDIAKHVGVSGDHLTRCFRQELNLTPIAYLSRYRVNQAKTLLTEGQQSVADIAMAVGFSDSNYFSRVFRCEVGVSPLAYRRAGAPS